MMIRPGKYLRLGAISWSALVLASILLGPRISIGDDEKAVGTGSVQVYSSTTTSESESKAQGDANKSGEQPTANSEKPGEGANKAGATPGKPGEASGKPEGPPGKPGDAAKP